MNTSVPANRPWHKTYQQFNISSEVNLPMGVHTLIDYFEKFCKERADAVAFTCHHHHLSYKDLDEQSLRLAAYLQQLGLNQGDKIAVMLPNVLAYPIVMMAVIRAGFVLVNVNPLYTPRELLHQLSDADAKVLFTAQNFMPTVQEVLADTDIRQVCVTHDMMGFDESLDAQKHSYQRPNLSGDDVALLQYTGGTTGVAKGAMLTHSGLITNVYQLENMIGGALNIDDEKTSYILTALPLYHIFAFVVCVLFGMKVGLANLLVTNPRDLSALINAINTHKPTMIPAVNTLFNAMLSSEEFCQMDHDHVQLCVGGGMAILSDTARRWQAVVGKPIIEGCGLSEAGTVITVNPPSAGFTQNIGLALPLTDIKILDDGGQECPSGVCGEICVAGPQIMKGYWRREHEKSDYMTDDGYFKTGDIGIMDEVGFIKIVDRKKDVVNVSGFNVYPSEIEQVFSNHPDIIECCAVGVPDEHSHEAVKLFVVSHDDTLTIEDIQIWGRQYLTGYKLPKHVQFIDEIPKSAVGKILRKNLR